MLVARYTANASGVVPIFNGSYVYTVNETESNGVYTVEINADTDFTSCSFQTKSSLLTVEYLKVTSQVTNMNNMFQNCSKLTQVDASNWDTSKVTKMSNMFYGCGKLTTIGNVSNWVTSLVTDMQSMFRNCSSLIELDVSKWDTSKVANMQYMFNNCTKFTQLNVSKWDTSSVTSMTYMFNGCSSLTQLDLSNWDTSLVTTIAYMFYNCSNLTQLNVSKWDTSSVTTMRSMFSNCSSLTQLDVSKWKTNSVENMQYMFNGCSSLTQLDVSNWDTSKTTNMYSLFYNCSSLTQLDLSGWNTSSETDTDYMFDNCPLLNNIIMNNSDYSSINKIISSLPSRTSDNMGTLITDVDDESQIDLATANSKYWIVKEPTKSVLIARYTAKASGVVPTFRSGYQYTVSETESDGIYTVEIYSDSDFLHCSFTGMSNLLTVEYLKYTTNMTYMGSMFNGCTNLTQLNVSNWDTSKTTNMYAVFYGCSSLTQLDLSNWDTSQVANTDYMFQNCSSLTQLDVSNWDTSLVTDIQSMFRNCSSLTQLDVSKWDTSKVTSMRSTFENCSSLTQLDLNKWDTSSVTTMAYMFNNCSSLTQLDVSNFNTSKVTNMYSVFYDCSSLTQLDLSNWDTSKATNTDYMFYNCSLLNNIIMNNSDYSSINKIISLIPSRTSNNMGTLVTNESQIDLATANSIYWIVKGINSALIARYTANASGVVPTFNGDYVCTVNEIESNGVYTVEIYSDSDFTSCSFQSKSSLLTVEYLKVTSKVTNMDNMFYNCTKLTQLDVSNWVTSSVTTMYYTFYNCSSLTQLDLSNWDTSEVTNMNSMFYDCGKLTQLDVKEWETSKVNNMRNMFYGCSSLTQLDVSNWVTSSVTSMLTMFENCSSLTQLDLSKWDTSQVASMAYMFNNCGKLTQLDLSNWDTSKVTSTSYMFSNCSNLRKIKLLNTIFPQLPTVLPTRTSDNQGYLFVYEEISNDKNWNSYICKEFKTQIKLPQPLRRVGNVADRLYWDIENECYCIEKKISDDYTILATPIIIKLSPLDKLLDVYKEATIIKSNLTISPSAIQLESLILKLKPISLEPSTQYTVVFNHIGSSDITINLGGSIETITPTEQDIQIKVQITTPSILENELLSIYGDGNIISNIMLLTKAPMNDIGYIDKIQSIGELQEDGTYKIELMNSTSGLFFGKGGKKQ